MTERTPVKRKAAPKRKVPKKKAPQRKAVKAGESVRDSMAAAMKNHEHWPWPLRPFQQDAYDAFRAGTRRFGLFWHRRAGKDVFGMSVARQQMRQRVGSYVHFFPKHVHAKRALWRGVDPRKGARFIDIAFGDIEADRDNRDMLIEAYNGSTWALLGSDNYDSTVIGGNVVGVVFSEWALCDPNAWEYIRPILRENNGWAMFITTFRGRNHAWQMYQHNLENPDWYISKLTIEDTTDVDGNRIIAPEDVEKDRRDGMKEALIQQEYYCNPEATMDGAIYGKETAQLLDDETRHRAQWNSTRPVYCSWNIDLPIHATYVLSQPGGIILEAHTERFTTLAEALAKAEQHRFPIQTHLLHDRQREYVKHFQDLDRSPQILSNTNIILEQTATSALLHTCQVARDKCDVLLDSLGGYVRRESFNAQVADMHWGDNPVDSWHQYMVNALETWAAWEYSGAGEWRSKPDYTQMDRLARTVR